MVASAKVWSVRIGALFLVLWLGVSALIYSGFCFPKLGWLSDRDLYQAAFRHELTGGWSNTPDVADVSAFIADYPRCCTIEKSGGLLSSSVINAMLLRRFFEVTVTYPVTNPSENDGDRFYTSILIMECCGDRVPDSFGMGSSTPIPKG